MDHQLNTLAIDDKLQIPGFLGTFACDEIPKKPKKVANFSLVVNVDPADKPGSHWIGIIFSRNVLYFVDSYGRTYKDHELFPGIFTRNIRKFIGDLKVVCNRKMLQQLVSNACGDYAVYFIREITKNGFRKAMSVFSENLKKNDEYVVNYVKIL